METQAQQFTNDPRVQTLKSCLDGIRAKGVRADITEAYIIWQFPMLLKSAGFRDDEIYDFSAAAGIHPPDAGSAWIQAQVALMDEFQEASIKDAKLAGSFAAWLEDQAKALKDFGDPAFELMADIASDVLEQEEGHPVSDKLYKAARDAEDRDDHLAARQCMQMAELAEEDEDRALLQGNKVIWRTESNDEKNSPKQNDRGLPF